MFDADKVLDNGDPEVDVSVGPRFSATTALMTHQETAVAKLLPSRVGAMFMEMGTGKSRTLLELARIRASKWDRLIWFCPVSLKETVRREVLKHTDIPEHLVYVFDQKTSETRMPLDAIIYVVGIESMASSSRVVLAVNKLVTEQSFVVVDESSYIKGHRALRTQRITVIGRRAKYRMVLTGTPFTQGVVDLFSQMTFLSPKILGYRSFHTFAANHLVFEEKMINGRAVNTGRILHSLQTDYLADRVAPYTYQVRKSECLTLPDKLYEDRYCPMTMEQRCAHEEAKREFLEQADENSVRPVWLFRLFTALQTIACGWWNQALPDGSFHLREFQHYRLGLLETVLHEIPADEPVVVWTKYRLPLDRITTLLQDEYGAGCVARYDGSLSELQRDAELTRWKSRGSRFLLATQAAGGHGLTLTESCHSVFYADGFKYSERIQAEDRTHRIGQTRSPTYVSLRCTGSIDDRIARALDAKESALASFIRDVDRAKAKGLKAKLIEMVRSL